MKRTDMNIDLNVDESMVTTWLYDAIKDGHLSSEQIWWLVHELPVNWIITSFEDELLADEYLVVECPACGHFKPLEQLDGDREVCFACEAEED